MVVAFTMDVKVLELLFCMAVPPIDEVYHLKIGLLFPEVAVTVATGMPDPHCDELFVVGEDGAAKDVIVTEVEIVQPADELAVTV